tara:strand:+ start:282 stop:458 length:177 start_codon:yes stop_codon:yes gene_type:complete
MIDTDKYEDEIYERIMQLEHMAKASYILNSDWDDIIGMLTDADRKEYDELMIMWGEIQ